MGCIVESSRRNLGKSALRAHQLGRALESAEFGSPHVIGDNSDNIRVSVGMFLSGNLRHRSGQRDAPNEPIALSRARVENRFCCFTRAPLDVVLTSSECYQPLTGPPQFCQAVILSPASA